VQAFQDHDRDEALGPGLVHLETGPDLGHVFVEAVALLAAVHDVGARREPLRAVAVRHLDLDLGFVLMLLNQIGCLGEPPFEATMT